MTEINEIAKAMSAFQEKAKGQSANKKGARGKYAGIDDIIQTAKQASPHGLSWTQPMDYEFDENGKPIFFVRTIIMHTSGQCIEGRYPIFVDDYTNSQKIGSAYTYAKRYHLSSMLGIAEGVEGEDDDGAVNGALDDPPKQPETTFDNTPENLDALIADCATYQDLNALFKQTAPTDPEIKNKFKTRKAELQANQQET